MVMELLKGADLHDFLFRDRECLTPETKFKFIIQMVAGIDYMHKKDIIHSNLDPRNIFITENMLVKIIGFSDVKYFKGMAMKNVSYSSPEELMDKDVDHRTDLYLLGMIFYWLFTGRRPFKYDGLNNWIQQLIYETPPPMKELDPEYQFLERVVMRLLEKKPDKRYQSAQDLLYDLTKNKEDGLHGTWYRH